MFSRAKLLLASLVMLTATAPAEAAKVSGQISVGGLATPIGSPGWVGATGVDAARSLIFYDAGTGSFSGLSCSGSCGTLADIPSLAGFVPIVNYMTLAGTGFSFDLNSIDSITQADDSLVFTGTGLIKHANFEDTIGFFSFTAQGGGLTSFSATTGAIPEPGTWALMLLGFGAIGYSMRRRRTSAQVLPQAA